MVEIPITISSPDCYPPLKRSGGEQHHDKEQRLPGSVPEAPSVPTSPQVTSIITSMISEGTQTDVPDSNDSTIHSHTDSLTPNSTLGEWTDHFHHPQISAPSPRHSNIPAYNLLSPPGSDLPHRPLTPRADLYHGQESANFGMTFGTRPTTHRGFSSRPAGCVNKYEDQKHRMVMNWLERRGTV